MRKVEKTPFWLTLKSGKSGKMFLKIKPWKSDTKKLPLSCQFLAACKKLEKLNEPFPRTRLFFRNLTISICSNIKVTDNRKKFVKTTIFTQFCYFKTLYQLNRLWQAQISHRNSLFLTLEQFYFFDKNCWVRNVKNQFFSKSQKKLVQSIQFIKLHFTNLFRMLFMTKDVKFTHFEKSQKNTFLVKAKKWKKWEKWS